MIKPDEKGTEIMKKGLKNADFADKNSGSCKEVGLTQLNAPCLKDRICIPIL